MDGHGRVSARSPPPTGIFSPRSFLISALMPGNGRDAEPGRVVATPGSAPARALKAARLRRFAVHATLSGALTDASA